LEALKPKVGSLDFWSEVKVVTTQKEVAAATKPKEEKQSLVPFPTSPKVYHFHPIAFVEQMRMRSGPTSPPWMELALAEAKALME